MCCSKTILYLEIGVSCLYLSCLLSYIKAENNSLTFIFSLTYTSSLLCEGEMSAGILYLAVEVWNYEFNEILISMCSFEFEFSIIQISDEGLYLDAMEESASFFVKT